HASVLKPIGVPFTDKTVDFHSGVVSDISIQPVENEEDISNTVAVMGGEDWKFWIEDLKAAGVLAEGVKTVAYSYIGPELTYPIYRNGTIGRAKDDLEGTVPTINEMLKDINGVSYVSVNKALVTQSSSAIPVVPLYISLLYKVMKEKGIHEGTIEQMQRLFADRLYGADLQLEDKGRTRVDDWECVRMYKKKYPNCGIKSRQKTLKKSLISKVIGTSSSTCSGLISQKLIMMQIPTNSCKFQVSKHNINPSWRLP